MDSKQTGGDESATATAATLTTGLMAGKTGLILNVANDRSIAWHIADQTIKAGATCGFGYLPLPKMERRVRKAMEEGGFADSFLHPCDVGDDASIDSFFAAAKEKFGKIDFLVHSLAFADREYLQVGKFAATPREVFKQALDISAYSLIALTRGALPLMSDGGSVIAMTYLGSDRAVPGYNVMGVAKAALESTSRYLASELGERNIRFNTISAGPVRTLSAMAVGGIDEMFEHTIRKAPLRRNIDPAEVGKTAVYLLSDLSSGVTGENVYVDAGFNTVGM
jgi:enoyl-[acyl-carrier protein] reductase I